MPMSRDEWNSCEDHLLVSVAAGTGNTKPHSTKHRDGITRILWLSNIALACICILLIINTLSASRLCPSYGSNVHDEIIDTYSPANEDIDYEYRRIFNDTRFLGPPEAEWHELMQSLLAGTLIRVSEEELDKHASTSVPLRDGGYAAGLGVAHSLHCVRLIKKMIFREFSYPDADITSDELHHAQIHADHCLDYLRQSIMCRADYSMYTLYWATSQQGNKPVLTHHPPKPQKCVNWDKLHAWMQDRSASSDMIQKPSA